MELSSVTYPPPSGHKAWDHKSLRQNLGQGRSLRNQFAEFPSIYSHRARGHCPLLLHIRMYLLVFPQDCWTGWQWGSKQANTSVEEQQLCRQADCPGASPQHWLDRYFRKWGSWVLKLLIHWVTPSTERCLTPFSSSFPKDGIMNPELPKKRPDWEPWPQDCPPSSAELRGWQSFSTKHAIHRTQFTVLLVSSLRPTVTVLGHYRNPKV